MPTPRDMPARRPVHPVTPPIVPLDEQYQGVQTADQSGADRSSTSTSR